MQPLNNWGQNFTCEVIKNCYQFLFTCPYLCIKLHGNISSFTEQIKKPRLCSVLLQSMQEVVEHERSVGEIISLLLCPSWAFASVGSNYRMQGHFGPPVLHVSKSFEEQSITQLAPL